MYRFRPAGLCIGIGLLSGGLLWANDFQAHHARGEELIKKGSLPEAIPHLERAYRLEPGHYVNAWDLALAYVRTGNLEAGRRHITEMLRQHDTAELHALLGEVEERSGQRQEAAKHFEAAARMEPSPTHIASLANFLLRAGALQPSIDTWLHGIARNPEAPELRIGLGIAYHAAGRYDEAVQSLCEAVDLNPRDSRPILFLGKMLDTAPQLNAELARRLARFAELYPANALARLYYGLSLWKQAESESRPINEALIEKHLKAAVSADPRLSEAHAQLGILYERQGKDLEAIRSFRAAIRVGGPLESIHYRLARAYQRTGQLALAEKEMAAYKRVRAAEKR